MRRRLEEELAEENGDFYNLKVGRGGLLDVEFVAQYLQLRHGGERVELRGRSTLAVLEAARELGVLAAAPAETLSVGYRFLRRLESRLRIVRDRSDERLPAHEKALEVIARRLSYRQHSEVSAARLLLDDYRRHTVGIRRAYEEILDRGERS
jgi:glutamate-ammonia-ligase adenylyltransferase